MLVVHSLFVRAQADKSRVKDYIHRLDNFDGPAVGEIAVGYEMFDEAFEIYRKFGLKTQAIRVLLEHHEDLDRALEYALKVPGLAPPSSIPGFGSASPLARHLLITLAQQVDCTPAAGIECGPDPASCSACCPVSP
jgi:hypothetical protein